MERHSVTAQVKDIADDRKERRLGQIFGFVISIAFITLGATAILASNDTSAQISGAIFGGGGAIGLVSLFVIGREKKTTAPTPNAANDAVPELESADLPSVVDDKKPDKLS